MKKLLFTAATGLLCFIISCNDTATTSSTVSSDREKNTEHNKEVYRAIETGDVSKLDSFIDKDIVDHSGEHGDIRGLDSVKKEFVRMHNEFKDLKFDIQEEATSPDGEYHFSWFKMKGTCTVPSMGMPAGTHMDMTGIDVVRIKDGKAVEHWAFSDPNEMMKMMNMSGHDMGKMEGGKMDSMPPKDSMKK
jgi:predicted ester cyclase